MKRKNNFNHTDSTLSEQQKWEKMPTFNEYHHRYGNDTIVPDHVASLAV